MTELSTFRDGAFGNSGNNKPDLSESVAAAWTKPEGSTARNLMLGGAAVVIGGILHEKPAGLERVVEAAEGGLERVGKAAKELFTPKQWDIAKGTSKLAREVVSHSPQVDDAGRLQSYITGSVANTLLARSGRFTEIESGSLPHIVRGKTVELSPDAMQTMAGMVRKITDVDVTNVADVNRGYGRFHSFTTEALPKSAKKVFKESSDYVPADPHTRPLGADEIIAVPVKDGEVFVAHPATQMSWKLGYVLHQWGTVGEKKGPREFESLYRVASTLRDEKQLVDSTAKALAHFDTDDALPFFIPRRDPNFTGALRDLTEKVIQANPDSKYLGFIRPDPERAVGYLRVLNRLESDADKNTVVNFINEHHNLFATRAVDWTSPNNTRRIVNEILFHRPEIRSELAGKGITTPAQIAEEIGQNLPIREDVLRDLPKQRFDMAITHSHALQSLYEMDPTKLPSELARIAGR